MKPARRMLNTHKTLSLGFCLLLSFSLSGCAVVAVADTAVSVAATAVKVGATVVETAVDVTAAGVRAVVGKDEKEKK